ncbi:hypothetical protein SAY87_014361 [Trapa incisa]|uniref:Uncharacterized protein n=1 Tax=Trapa incisa TaxID=236973 RepID=A0AAN7JL42_9MYRT|nr:hypothetical protein SAY87_014361 [Trapa incisa]
MAPGGMTDGDLTTLRNDDDAQPDCIPALFPDLCSTITNRTYHSVNQSKPATLLISIGLPLALVALSGAEDPLIRQVVDVDEHQTLTDHLR